MSVRAMQLQLQSMLKGAEIVSGGVDYLCVTSAQPAAQAILLSIFNRGAAQAERLGDERKKGGFQGFMGWRVGPWLFGRREETVLLRIQGGLAHDVFHDIPWPACHCSRVDVQVTLRTQRPELALGRLMGTIREANAKEKNIKLHPTQDLRGVYEPSQTLYIGSRESPRFARAYDKDAQSGDEAWRNCWRLELECKKVLAPLMAEWLRQESDLRIAAIQSVVGQYEEWGLPIAIGVAGKLIAGSIGRRDFDSERVLGWLRTQVAPSIEKLLGTVDRETVLEALRLAEPGPVQLPPVTQEWIRETGQDAASSPQNTQAQRDATRWW